MIMKVGEYEKLDQALYVWFRQEREKNTPITGSIFAEKAKVLCILCTLPVTSCSSERSFSGLKRIKTALRSNMGNQRLTGLSLLHLHHDIPVDTSAVIDDFSCRYPRRMKLTNILED